MEHPIDVCFLCRLSLFSDGFPKVWRTYELLYRVSFTVLSLAHQYAVT